LIVCFLKPACDWSLSQQQSLQLFTSCRKVDSCNNFFSNSQIDIFNDFNSRYGPRGDRDYDGNNHLQPSGRGGMPTSNPRGQKSKDPKGPVQKDDFGPPQDRKGVDPPCHLRPDGPTRSSSQRELAQENASSTASSAKPVRNQRCDLPRRRTWRRLASTRPLQAGRPIRVNSESGFRVFFTRASGTPSLQVSISMFWRPLPYGTSWPKSSQNCQSHATSYGGSTTP
jgi:hypothetical protein